jgi:hypothetical protein
MPFACRNDNDSDTGNVMQVIRATDIPATGGHGGLRIFRMANNTSVLSMQNSTGGFYGDFGTTIPHINVNITYRIS